MKFSRSAHNSPMMHRYAITMALLLFPAGLHADWRKDLLKEQGIGMDKASLQKAAKNDLAGAKTYQQAFEQLSSEDFAVREQGQRVLIDADKDVLDFLDGQEPIKDPEVRFRVAEIRKSHTGGLKIRMAPMIRWAAKSILQEPDAADAGKRYYEWFGKESENCNEGYRKLTYEGGNTAKARVEKGRLLIPAGKGQEDDQRLVLLSKARPGEEKLPQSVRVSCLMGGGPAGGGTWHVALSVGKCKALFHPGYRGGAFRFEQVGTNTAFSENSNMRFTPKPDQLYRVELIVTLLPNDKVSYDAVITSPDNELFKDRVVLTAAQVGELDRVGLERSGRQGGDAIFDDLQVELQP